MTTRICVFEGDDAAPEAIRPTVELLERLNEDPTLDLDAELEIPSVADHVDALDAGTVPESLARTIDDADTVLFGAANRTHLPILWYLRREYGGGTIANVRPVRYLDGATTPLTDPTGIDYTIVRENLEGLYFGAEGDLGDLAEALPSLAGAGGTRLAGLGSGRYAIRVTSEAHTRRFASFACEFAAARATGEDRVSLTCATKSNVLTETDGLIDAIVEETAASYDRVRYEHLHTDDVAQRLVTDPGRFDVIVTPNYAGDLLSDAGAGTIGGLGLAPSGCYGPEAAYFEPVHGTAPDIVDENAINPTATMLSAAMLLDYVDAGDAASRLRRALETVYAAGDALTPDQGGSASTTDFAAAVADGL